MQLTGHGLRASLPAGWEGSLRGSPRAAGAPGQLAAQAHEPAPSLLHAGTFALPAERGDFGSGAVEVMRSADSFVALLEYEREELGTALFAARGLPRRLDPRRFDGASLQRTIRGQVGWQHFFTEADRPFCLYVVLGDGDDRRRQLRSVELALHGITIEPRAGR